MAFTSYSHFKIRDFLVDFFGCLIPGFLFTFLLSLTIGWPMLSLYISPLCRDLKVGQIFQANSPENFKWVVLIFVLALSYVLGHILFRLDPKLPDERSVWRQRKAIYLKDRQDDAVRASEGKEKYDPSFMKDFWYTLLGLGFKEKNEKVHKVENDKCKQIESKTGDNKRNSPDVQFPYLYLYEYLEQRGLTHLADLIKWKGSDPKTHHLRSKAFINILKIRLDFAFPEKCGTIIRNEAHIRLMSSLWYMLLALQWFSLLGVVISFIAVLIFLVKCNNGWYERHFLPLLVSFVMIFVAFFARYTIEKFIHYQRCREIICVLETAYFAQKFKIMTPDGKHMEGPDILKDIQ